MGKSQRIVMTVLWGVLVLMMLGVITLRALRSRAEASADEAKPLDEPQVLYREPAFSLTDQNGNTVSDKTLAGHAWIIDFIFTHCAGPCPLMTARMAELQKQIPNPSVKFVSVSVDPERDTPSVLKAYAGKFRADESRWHFLTGKKSDVYELAAGFKLTAKPADPESDILHDERFLLIDQNGDVCGIYHSKDLASMSKLVTDATELASRPAAHPAPEGTTQP